MDFRYWYGAKGQGTAAAHNLDFFHRSQRDGTHDAGACACIEVNAIDHPAEIAVAPNAQCTEAHARAARRGHHPCGHVDRLKHIGGTQLFNLFAADGLHMRLAAGRRAKRVLHVLRLQFGRIGSIGDGDGGQTRLRLGLAQAEHQQASGADRMKFHGYFPFLFEMCEATAHGFAWRGF